MQVIILGSGTGVPSLKRGAPGLLIKVKGQILLFDSGPGTLHKLLQAKIDYRKIDYIFYTHFHPDHITELVSFLFACKYHSSPRVKPLKIVGPKGFKDFYSKILKMYGKWVKPEKYKIEIHEINNVPYQGKGWTIYTKPLNHTYPCIGYRIEAKTGHSIRSIVYSGDTDYCREIVELAENADLFISECSFPEKHRLKGHLTPRLAGRIANESGCKHLVLTHLYPICDKFDIFSECRREYKGKLTLAKDLLKITI